MLFPSRLEGLRGVVHEARSAQPLGIRRDDLRGSFSVFVHGTGSFTLGSSYRGARSSKGAVPAALSIPMNKPKYNWGFATEPEPHLGGRQLATPRGKVLGGSSSINGMVWVRGTPLDFDGWEKQGAEGWGYRHVLPYFRRADAHEGGDPQYRGSDGPLYNCYGRLDNPLHHVLTRSDACARDPRAVLGRACRGCGVSPERRGAQSVRGARGDPGGRADQ